MSSNNGQQEGEGTEMEIRDGPETVPVWLEVSVVGGLGFVVYFGPTLYQLAKDSVNAVWPRVERPVRSLLQKAKQRWEPLNRRRKNGSLVRVLADLLPDFCFAPTPRIYIAGIYPAVELRREFMTFGSGSSRLTGFGTKDPSQAEKGSGDGVIVAFEFDAESECTELDEVGIDVSSNPEGWDQNMSTIPLFGANGTRFKCSTPTPRVPDCYQMSVLNDSFSTEGTDFDDNGKTQEEIANLKNIIQDLVKQMSVLNENMTMRQNQPDSLMSFVKSPPTFDLPPPPANMLPSFAEVVGGKPSAAPPPPPPPPPPPMPQQLFQGSAPLKITKAKNAETKPINQTPAPSMMDILKDLNKVKLRSAIQRSPGGTPVKVKVNDRNSLEYALKKRFESMHSPPGSDDENVDKENEFDDSLLKQKNSPRRFQGKRVNRKSNSSVKSRTPLFEKISNEVPPFGPHLLKKRNGN